MWDNPTIRPYNLYTMDKLKVFTAFSGYDSQCMALEMAGNSIVVDVLAGIFTNLIKGCEKPEDYLF